MSNLIRTELYLGEYSTPEELYAAIPEYWSGSRFTTYHCPRKGEYLYELGLERVGEDQHYLVAGSVVHAALNYYYAHGGAKSEDKELEERTLQVLRDEIDQRGGLAILPADHKSHHLSLGHLEIILKSHYFPHAKLEDGFEVVTARLEDLDMTDVVGARLHYTEDGRVLLGESAFLVRMATPVPWSDKPKEYLYAAIPDLPIYLGNSFYIMEHKTTSWNLSSFWAAKWRLDNTLRTYCVLMSKLLRRFEYPLRGVYLNGISVQANASNFKSKCTRVARYGPWDFEPPQLMEALWNHAAALEIRDFIRTQLSSYYPQAPGMQCAKCDGFELCATSPDLRNTLVQLKYKQRDKRHLFTLNQDEEKENE